MEDRSDSFKRKVIWTPVNTIVTLDGSMLSLVFTALIGLASSYPMLLLFISLASVGASIFHPSIAGMIAGYAGRHLGFSMPIFNIGWTLAFGIGPLIVAYAVASFGLSALLWTTIPELALMVLIFRIVPPPRGEGLRGQGFVSAVRTAFGEVWKAMFLICAFHLYSTLWTNHPTSHFVGGHKSEIIDILSMYPSLISKYKVDGSSKSSNAE